VNITIVVPTYNEAQNLPLLVTALFDLPQPDLNLIVVDDNSPDGTGKIADDLASTWQGHIQVIHRTGKLGLGTAYIQAFQLAIKSGADIIGQMDADFSHPIEKIPALISAAQNTDIALGSRYIPGGSLDDNWPVWRKSLSSFGNFYARSILGLPVKDATGGYRFWRKATLEGMPLHRVRSNGYVFQVEMIYLATILGYKACEIPIHFADRRWGKSKMNLRIQLEAALRVWQLPGMYQDLKHHRSLQ
jgi:dolichol-phosphate mannosyltransferase